ncbi:MAG: carbohydrate binding domain-containing protein, partial [Armatimonadetes bacterium]|nr:carbohydrate binding domain-containing protein [Armatimonadota bacterium]
MRVAVLVAAWLAPACGAAAEAPNLVRNAGFEQVVAGGGMPADWSFAAGNGARATCAVDPAAHTGERCLRLTNQSARFPHVYGHLYQAAFAVKPSTGYVFGLWVKADHAGYAWFGGGREWRLRWRIPEGTYDWQWIGAHYVTQVDETTFELRVI